MKGDRKSDSRNVNKGSKKPTEFNHYLLYNNDKMDL